MIFFQYSPVRASDERYTVGVGQVSESDHVKREIIHQLCIHPMAHSELRKALPDDVSNPFIPYRIYYGTK